MKSLKHIFTQILLAFGLVLLNSACEKEPDYEKQGFIEVTVEGRAIDVYSQEPIDSAIVQIHSGLRSGLYPGFVNRTYVTNSNGYYSFKFKAYLDSSYYVSAVAQDYYTNYGISYNTDRLFNGNRPTSHAPKVNYHNPWKDNFEFNLSLVPSAILKVRVVNRDGVYDRFSMNTPAGSPLGNNIGVSGMYVDQEYEFTVYGGTELTLSTHRYRPGDGPGDGDYVPIKMTCLPHQVNTLLIEY
jgi:hypothetical protein